MTSYASCSLLRRYIHTATSRDPLTVQNSKHRLFGVFTLLPLVAQLRAHGVHELVDHRGSLCCDAFSLLTLARYVRTKRSHHSLMPLFELLGPPRAFTPLGLNCSCEFRDLCCSSFVSFGPHASIACEGSVDGCEAIIYRIHEACLHLLACPAFGRNLGRDMKVQGSFMRFAVAGRMPARSMQLMDAISQSVVVMMNFRFRIGTLLLPRLHPVLLQGAEAVGEGVDLRSTM